MQSKDGGTGKRFRRACRMILTVYVNNGRRCLGRKFDDCFEMGDGREVALRIAQRYEDDPQFRRACDDEQVKRFLGMDEWRKLLSEKRASRPLQGKLF